MSKTVRLDKFLADAGKGTRSEVKKYIQKGLVEINGQTVKKPEQKVGPEDRVLFKGEEIAREPEHVYYLLHKPAGYVSATEDKRDRTVMELIPSARKGLFPAGRLDKDTEGLLVLTNDGQLAHRVLSPKKHVPKTYYAKIQGIVTDKDVKAFEKGVTLDDGYETMPSQLKIIESGEVSEIELTIHEGKFHQVKRMFESLGKKVVYLKRLSMGKLILDESLSLGEYRELTDEEVKLIEER